MPRTLKEMQLQEMPWLSTYPEPELETMPLYGDIPSPEESLQEMAPTTSLSPREMEAIGPRPEETEYPTGLGKPEEISPGMQMVEGQYAPDVETAQTLARREKETEGESIRRIWEKEAEGMKGKAKERYLRKMEERIRATQPPEDFVAPDFSPEGEKRFEQHVFQQLEKNFNIRGGNPFLYNPQDEVQRADAMLPQIFNQYFQGQVTWGDRNTLDTEQQKAWNRVVQGYHAFVLEKATENQKRAEAAYQQMMGQFSAERKKRESAKEAIEKRRWEREKMRLGEEREIRKEERAEKRKLRKGKEPTRGDIQAISKAETDLREIFAKDGESPEFKQKLKVINAMRKISGLPPITRKIIQKGKKRKLFGIDFLMPDVPEKAVYETKYGAAEAGPRPQQQVPTQQYESKFQVRDAYRRGEITEAQAIEALRQF